jgi:hypothetical protein
VLFSIGSLCFAFAPFPGVSGLIGAQADAAVYFVGSIFFTSAAFLQYVEAVNADRGPQRVGMRERLTIFTWEPCRIDWWATLIQLVGTVLFNVNTFDAMLDLTPTEQDRFVWGPDVAGSVCFLVASALAYLEVRGRPDGLGGPRRELEWWIAVINLAGSIAFGVAAAVTHVNTATGAVADLALGNLATLIGALCFLAGAVLLMPEAARESRRPVPPPRPSLDPGPATLG